MERVWWKQITRANHFIDQVTEAALAEKSMILSLPESVPWYDTMVMLIDDILREKNHSDKRLEIIECPEEEAGKYLLEHYCKKEKRHQYRLGRSQAEFLAQSDDIVLNNTFLWVRDVNAKKCEEWVKFIGEYNQKMLPGRSPAVFILEVHDDSLCQKAKKGIKKFSFDQNITAYDKFAFCTLAATETDCKEYLRPYLAELISNICREDIELCAACVKRGSAFLKSPQETIQAILDTEWRSNGMEFQDTVEADEIRNRIWESQTKMVFPVIEKYRNYFIKKYQKMIQGALPVRNSFGEIIDKAEDIEIGTLVFMVGSGRLTLTSTAVYEELVMFRDARNTLAHLDVLPLEVVERILKWKGTE